MFQNSMFTKYIPLRLFVYVWAKTSPKFTPTEKKPRYMVRITYSLFITCLFEHQIERFERIKIIKFLQMWFRLDKASSEHHRSFTIKGYCLDMGIEFPSVLTREPFVPDCWTIFLSWWHFFPNFTHFIPTFDL